MSDADPHAVRGSQGGKKPTSFTLVSMPVPILAAQNVRGNSTSTVRFQKDEERTEYDRLSLYLPFDHTWSPPPLTEPDCDKNFPPHCSNVTSSTSLISRLQSFATSSTSVNSSSTNITAWCSTAAAPTSRPCSVCHRRISGQFLRALGTVFHFDCFRCVDCNIGVASEFFPLQGPDGKLQPICERDLYRRRDLTCAKCKQALKGGYIPAFNKKFHAEHFTCSVCSELLKPHGAWNGNGDLYCRRHYSIWYATKCTGCCTFVENPFVETELGSRKRWHRECYLLNKFWDIRLAKNVPQGPFPPETYTPEEAQHGLSATSEGQISAEALARLIWTRLSEYEESSLACLSDIARHVGNGLDLEAIQAAGRLVLHIEVLFAAIDELERAGAESLPQPSYAENLLYTASDLIETLSGAQDDPPESYPIPLEIQRERTVQALLALTPSLVSHHKNLVIIVLKEALKLKQGTSSGNAPLKFLNRLKRLAMDGADPNADRREYFTPANITNADASPSITTNPLSTRALEHFPSVTVDYSEGVAYGYQSLSPRCTGESPTSPNFILRAVKDGIIMLPFLPSDECIECLSPINEGCVRLGTYQRWHLRCFACATCGKSAEDKIDSWEGSLHENSSRIDASPEAREVPPPTNLTDFRYGFLTAPGSPFDTPKIYCTTHTGEELWHGGRFEEVTRLEQYAFLLYVAIRRSYYMLLGYSYVHTTTGK